MSKRKANPAKRGPKGKWDKVDPVKVAEAMGRLGATEAQLAQALGYTRTRVNQIKHARPELFNALKVSKEQADQAVEKSLYQRACGYEHKSIKMFKTSDDCIITKEFIEHYPPDTVACIFWLKNRQPDKWREKTDHALQNPDGSPLTIVVQHAHEAKATNKTQVQPAGCADSPASPAPGPDSHS